MAEWIDDLSKTAFTVGEGSPIIGATPETEIRPIGTIGAIIRSALDRQEEQPAATTSVNRVIKGTTRTDHQFDSPLLPQV